MIPIHCGQPMEYMGPVKIKGIWYTQYRCRNIKCGYIKNVKN